MKIALASDHAGYAEKERLKPLLQELGLEIEDLGTVSEDSVDYPDYAVRVGEVFTLVLTCAVVILLFAGSLLKAEFGTSIALLFIATMVAIGLGFSVFLHETRVASRAVRIRNELLDHEADRD